MNVDTSKDVLWFAWTHIGSSSHRVALPLYAPADWSRKMVCELAEKLYPYECFFTVGMAPDINCLK